MLTNKQVLEAAKKRLWDGTDYRKGIDRKFVCIAIGDVIAEANGITSIQAYNTPQFLYFTKKVDDRIKGYVTYNHYLVNTYGHDLCKLLTPGDIQEMRHELIDSLIRQEDA